MDSSLEYKENFCDKVVKVQNGNVIGSLLCQTGNQMFCTVAAMTFAKTTGRNFVGMVKTMGNDCYPEHIRKTIMRKVKYIDGVDFDEYVKIGGNNEYLCNYFPDTNEKNIWLNDFFQDVRCINKDIAYDLFEPYKEILNDIYTLYPKINDMVCIQVRRGDYLYLDDFNCYRKEEIIAIINEYFRDDEILFVSDDIGWCKENFHGEKYHFADREYISPTEIDLYLQTQSKANVISNSTFGWWGAFLNKRSEKVVSHWPWFKTGKINEMKYILPEDWIKFNY
jgi:hypothetical protein